MARTVLVNHVNGVIVNHVNGEIEQFKNVKVKYSCSYVTLKELEEEVMRTGEWLSDYLNILKSACAICKDEYVDSIDEIIEDVYVVTLEFKIGDKTFTHFYIDTYIGQCDIWNNILEFIQDFTVQDEIMIFDKSISSIDWVTVRQ